MDAVHYSSSKNDWATPQWLIDEYRAKGFAFKLDVCAYPITSKAPLCYTVKENGLIQPWHPYSPVWCNPPYGRGTAGAGPWLKKAVAEMELGCTSVFLLPARTDTRWWHDYVWDNVKQRPRRHREVDFRKGRITFVEGVARDGSPIYAAHAAPFPSVVVVFWGKEGF